MKWARRKMQVPPKTHSNIPPVIWAAIKAEHDEWIELMANPTPASLKKAGFQKWYICQSTKEKKIVNGFSDDDKFSYEAFVGGFLEYFERYDSKKKHDERTVFFDWQPGNKDAPLTIYLRPVYTPYNYYDKNDKLKKDPGGYLKSVSPKQSPLAPPPADGQTDPPGVPLPPPPPRRFEDQT